MQLSTTGRNRRPRFCQIAMTAIFSLAFGCAWAAKTGAEEPELRLTPKDARCLADHAELLLGDKGDPVDFYFDLCLAAHALRGNSRQSLPDVLPPPGKRKTEAKNAAAAPVRISKARLRCIQVKKAQNPAFFETDPVVLNSSACKL